MELHIPITEALTAVDCIAGHCDLSRARIKYLMQCGAVWRSSVVGESGANKTTRLRRAKTLLSVGEELHVYYDPEIIDAIVSPPEKLFDEKNYSVWFKPRGVYSQGTKFGDHHTMVRQVERLLQNDGRPVLGLHRLDRFTCGMMLLAHTKTAQRALSELFEQGNIEKHYLAVVEGEMPLSKAPQIIDSNIDDRSARSIVTVVDVANGRSLLDIQIETGRKHQVRKHLASLGYPVLGDRLHGNHSGDHSEDLQLCAISLGFVCPLSGLQRHYTLEHTAVNDMRVLLA